VTAARREPAFEAESEAYSLFRRGRRFLDRGHPGQAALLFERALALEPGRNSIREALGRALFSLGETERAAEQFTAIVADVPDNDYAQYALGRCLLKLGRAREGRGRLQLAAALAPNRATYRQAVADFAEP
jgi:tetratricopeptide (TPR) repeat protein